jgi:hypoxanthine phosphoribosyltransferase
MRPHHIRDVLFTPAKIEQRVNQLVDSMAPDCHAENFAMIGILRGSFMFLADLVRDLHQHGVHPRIDFIMLESYYSGTESTGTVHVAKDISLDVQGATVLLVDDILDSGRTLSFARNHLQEKGAKEIKTCALLDKPSCRVVPFMADYVGFTIEDAFVVGYGLDYDGYYRELPYIARVTFVS